MRLGVLGAGAVGSYLAARLADAGNEVRLLARPARRTALASGLVWSDAQGRHETRIPLVMAFAEPLDAILVAVKSFDIGSALDLIPPSATLVVCLQNGLGALETATEKFGVRAAGALLVVGATLDETGVHGHGDGLTVMGTLAPPTPPALHPLAACLSAAGLPAEVAADFPLRRFEKLAVNAIINPLTALLDAPNGVVLEPVHRAWVEALGAEIAAVAQAEGFALEAEALTRRAREVARQTAANTSSMCRDLARGGRTEREAILGSLLELAASHTLSVPLLTELDAQLRLAESGRPARLPLAKPARIC